MIGAVRSWAPGLTLFLLIAGCGAPEREPDLNDLSYAALPSEPLVGRPVYRDPRMEGVWRLWRVGDDLLLGPGIEDSVVAVVSLKDFSRRGFVARWGGGPGEFRAVADLATLPSGTGVALFDPVTHRVVVRPTGQLVASDHAKDRSYLTPNTVFSMAALTDSTFLSQGFLDTARVLEWDAARRVVRRFGALPRGEPEAPTQVAQQAYQSTIVTRPDHLRFALLQQYAGGIDIVDAGSGAVTAAAVPFPYPPFIKQSRHGSRPTFVGAKGVRIGYVAGDANAARIFALFSGHTIGGHAEVPTDGEYVHVFDWSGRLIRVFHLDRPVGAIALSADATTLYAGVGVPDPGVIAYPLPPEVP